MKRLFVSALALCGVLTVVAQPQMSYEEAEAKANEYIAKLTLDEKLAMPQGHNRFFFPAILLKIFSSLYCVYIFFSNSILNKF